MYLFVGMQEDGWVSSWRAPTVPDMYEMRQDGDEHKTGTLLVRLS